LVVDFTWLGFGWTDKNPSDIVPSYSHVAKTEISGLLPGGLESNATEGK